MSITIKDETAGVLVLTIDNSGQMYFGNGTPVNMLTINGYGIIDSNGQIIYGLGSTSAAPASGTATCNIGAVITITTLAGRIPNVQIDDFYPSTDTFMDFRDPGDPSSGGSETVSTNNAQTVHTVLPISGGFEVQNNNSCDDYVNNPSGPYYDPSVATTDGSFVYRWI